MSFKMNSLSTYGILAAYTEKELTERIHFLIAEQFLAMEEGKFPTLKLNKNSVDVLKGKRTVWMYTAPIPTSEAADYHEGLFSVLRQLRKKVADEKNVPPYVLFSDATLRDLCRYFPESMEDMLQIKGIGKKKYEQYGELFMHTIQKWRKENLDVKPKIQISSGHTIKPIKRKNTRTSDGPSHLESYKMFQAGKTIKEIATMHNMTEQTIEKHLFKAFKDGHPLAWGIFFTESEEKKVLEVHKQLDSQRLKPLKEALPEEYSYRKITAVLIRNGLM